MLAVYDEESHQFINDILNIVKCYRSTVLFISSDSL